MRQKSQHNEVTGDNAQYMPHTMFTENNQSKLVSQRSYNVN